SAEPGSCPPNWLHGKPITVKPFASYFFCTASSAVYCGVRPHLLATFTIISALPRKLASVVSLPCSVLIGAVHIGRSLATATGAGAVPAGGRLAGSELAAVGP